MNEDGSSAVTDPFNALSIAPRDRSLGKWNSLEAIEAVQDRIFRTAVPEAGFDEQDKVSPQARVAAVVDVIYVNPDKYEKQTLNSILALEDELEIWHCLDRLKPAFHRLSVGWQDDLVAVAKDTLYGEPSSDHPFDARVLANSFMVIVRDHRSEYTQYENEAFNITNKSIFHKNFKIPDTIRNSISEDTRKTMSKDIINSMNERNRIDTVFSQFNPKSY